jgi:hypothetical protein
MCRALILSGLLSLLTTFAAHAQLLNENLLAGAPEGYKVVSREKDGDIYSIDAVPNIDTATSWTAQVTIMTFSGLKMTPEEFRTRMEKGWKEACPAGRAEHVADGTENGYRFAMWAVLCPRNPKTGKPENTWVRAVQGNDNFYLVQKAHRFMPSREEVKDAVKYLETVTVCDSRIADRPCPMTRRL